MTVEKRKFTLHEDWAVVILGALVILLSLFFYVVPIPSYSWGNGVELSAKVFKPENLQILLIQFVFVSIIGALGAALTGKSVKNFIIGF